MLKTQLPGSERKKRKADLSLSELAAVLVRGTRSFPASAQLKIAIHDVLGQLAKQKKNMIRYITFSFSGEIQPVNGSPFLPRTRLQLACPITTASMVTSIIVNPGSHRPLGLHCHLRPAELQLVRNHSQPITNW